MSSKPALANKSLPQNKTNKQIKIRCGIHFKSFKGGNFPLINSWVSYIRGCCSLGPRGRHGALQLVRGLDDALPLGYLSWMFSSFISHRSFVVFWHSETCKTTRNVYLNCHLTVIVSTSIRVPCFLWEMHKETIAENLCYLIGLLFIGSISIYIHAVFYLTALITIMGSESQPSFGFGSN